MPRKPRLHVPGAFYHVTLRGNHRQDIFFTPQDRELLDQIVGEVLERFAARAHAFCWMTNHAHLLIQVADTPLGRIMMRVAGQYARKVQRRFCTTGHLFEQRYHSVLVDADEYLLELVRYIHLNPVRAHMVGHPDDYAWSSHANYLGSRVTSWVTTSFALSMLHPDPAYATDAYRRFVDHEVGKSHSSPLIDRNPNDVRVLGSDQFLGKSLMTGWRPRSRKSLDEIIDEACREFSVSREELESPSRQRRLSRVRAWVAHQAVEQRITSLAQVARAFHRDASSLSDCVARHYGPLPKGCQ